MAARTASDPTKISPPAYPRRPDDDASTWMREPRGTTPASSKWTPRLRTLALIVLTLVGVVVAVQGGTFVLDEFLRRRAAVYGGAPASVFAEARVKAHPDARAPASSPHFDEFAIRATVKEVRAPAGTGLPNIERLTVEPGTLFPITVHLLVEGVDNAAWRGLDDDARQSYADEIAQALVGMYPEIETTKRWNGVYYLVKIHERLLVDPAEAAGLDEEIQCRRAQSRGGEMVCRRIGAAAVVEVPTRKAG